MYRVTIMRITVNEEEADGFEAHCAEQVARVWEREPHNCLYVFVRRDPSGSSLLPRPKGERRDYLHLQAYATREAYDHHRGPSHESWLRILRTFQEGTWEAESYHTREMVAGISRDWTWDTDLYRFAVHRFQAREDAGGDLEGHMVHQIGIVTKGEPGTPLYTFCRREREGSALLPTPRQGRSEYLHLAAFSTEQAYDQHAALARRKDGQWAWASTFPPYLDAPLVNESFYSGSVVSGFSRNAQWGAVWGDDDIPSR